MNTLAARAFKVLQAMEGRPPDKSLELLNKDCFVDSFIALFEELQQHTSKGHSKHVASFLEKYSQPMSELRGLCINPADFQKLRLIGSGHFGEVHVVREKESGVVYAMKSMRKTELLAQRNVAFYEEERDIMVKAIDNPWLATLHYAFQDVNCLYLVMDFYPGGDLGCLISRKAARLESFDEACAKFYLAEIVMAVHAVHQLGYLHRDVKPENVLIDRTGHIKLVDFGSAAKMNEKRQVTGKLPVGTPDYVSPELLTSLTASGTGTKPYSVEVDWWSVGVIAYELFFGCLPFSSGTSIITTYGSIMKFKDSLKLPDNHKASDAAVQLVKNLLQEAQTRLNFEGLCKHHFFSAINFADLRSAPAPVVPAVKSQDDTSNFDECKPRKHDAGGPAGGDAVARDFKDVPFIGFTYVKTLGDCRPLSSSCTLQDLFAPSSSALANAEKQRSKDIEQKELALRDEVQLLRRALSDKNEYVKRLEAQRETQARDIAYLNVTKEKLEEENQRLLKKMSGLRDMYEETTKQTEDFLQVLREKDQQQSVYEEQMNAEIAKLMAENESLDKLSKQYRASLDSSEVRIGALEQELAELKRSLDAETASKSKLRQQCRSDRRNTLIVRCEIETEQQSLAERELELQAKLDEVLAHNEETVTLLESERKRRRDLEEQLQSARSGCTVVDSELKQRLSTSEQKRQILEAQVHLLPQLECRNEALLAELSEKSEKLQQLAKKIADLSESLQSNDRALRSGKSQQEEKERQLLQKIGQLELELKNVRSENSVLRDRSYHSVDDAEDKHNTIAEHESTISHLRFEVKRLEEQISDMKESYEYHSERKEHRGKQETRRWAEIVGELKQEKLFLDTKIGHLEQQLKVKDNFEESYKKRLSAVRKEVDESRTVCERELKGTRDELSEARLALAAARADVESLRVSEGAARARICQLESDVQSTRSASKLESQALREKNAALTAQVELLQENFQIIDELEVEVRRLSQKCASLTEENKTLQDQVSSSSQWKAHADIRAEKAQIQASESQKQAAATEHHLKQLKEACKELEQQVVDLESLNQEYEAREQQWESERKAIKGMQAASEAEITRLQRSLASEQEQRVQAEARVSQLRHTVEAQGSVHQKTQQTTHRDLEERTRVIEKLQKDVRNAEQQKVSTEQRVDELEHRMAVCETDIRVLKEEVASLKSQNNTLRDTNFKLTQSLEDIVNKYEKIKEDKHMVENTMENLVLTYDHEKFKLESIMAQQTKLIDYLQVKYEDPGRKKKTCSSTDCASAPKPCDADEFTQHTLECERNRARKLQDEVNELRAELYEAKLHALKAHGATIDCLSKSSSTVAACKPTSLDDRGRLLEKPSPPPPPPTPKSQVPSLPVVKSSASASKVPTGTGNTASPAAKPKMLHNIPHRMHSSFVTRACKCAVCLGSVPFGRNAIRCQECRVVVHSDCRNELPATCGLPTQYARLFEETAARRRTCMSSAGGVLEASLKLVELGGWMKVRSDRSSAKSQWERRFVLLEDSRTLSFFASDSETSRSPLDHFDMCPRDGLVSVHSSVSSSEVPATATADIPYVFKIEHRPHTTRWPAVRTIYLMAPNFAEKQKWVATLEALVQNGSLDEAQRESKLLGNRLVQLGGSGSSSSHIDVYCSMLVGEDILLLGAEEGLFAVRLSLSSEPLIKIEGIAGVYQMLHSKSADKLIAIVGAKRWLMSVDFSLLQARLEQVAITGEVRIAAQGIASIQGCTLFASGLAADGAAYVVAATEGALSVLRYSTRAKEFVMAAELVTDEPCSSLCFGPTFFILGATIFHKVNLVNYKVESFLGAAVVPHQKTNVPVSVLHVDGDTSKEMEFLCCFTEVGIFVKSDGTRSRSEDLKWSGMPLAFAYREPYLYVFYFNTMQVIGPLTNKEYSWRNLQTFLNIQNPRYLGPAFTTGAVYLASVQNGYTDILCFKGNLNIPDGEEKENHVLVKPQSSQPPPSPTPLSRGSSEQFLSGRTPRSNALAQHSSNRDIARHCASPVSSESEYFSSH